MSWMQNLPALGVITVAIAGIGTLQRTFHELVEGEPRPTGRDNFDWAMMQRDKRLKEEGKL